MKRLLPILLAMPMLASCVFGTASKDDYTKLPPEGKTFDVKSFKAIDASGVFNIILAQGAKESVVVKGDMLKTLTIKNDGETLVLDDGHLVHVTTSAFKTDIYITVTKLTDIDIKTVGETSCSDTLKLKSLSFHSKGVSNTTLWLKADSVDITTEGVGKVSIAGRASAADMHVSGVGSLDAKDFKVDVLHAHVSGVGGAKVYANKELYLHSSGVGGLEYSGPAMVIEKESSGVGKVEHED